MKGSGSGLPGGLHLVFWKFKTERSEGFWGFVIWIYASSAISKKNVVKDSGGVAGNKKASLCSERIFLGWLGKNNKELNGRK